MDAEDDNEPEQGALQELPWKEQQKSKGTPPLACRMWIKYSQANPKLGKVGKKCSPRRFKRQILP
jgi:hypothetical protein